MELLLSWLVRCFAFLLVDLIGALILGALCYWLGWPWVKLLSFGRYPRYGWRSGQREVIWVQCAGLLVAVLGMMLALGQFGV